MEISSTLKNSVIALIVVAAALVGKKLFSFITNGGKLTELFNNTKSENGKVIALPIQPTDHDISNTEASIYAERLFGAMDRFGTDEKAIFEILTMDKSRNDIRKIYNAFGFRRYFVGARGTFLGVKLNLTDWLRSELSKADFAKINNVLVKGGLI